jgi:hypothetical protein
LENVQERDTGPHDLRIEGEDAEIVAVADDHPLVGIEHAQPMRHVLDGRRKALILVAQFVRDLPWRGDASGSPSADGRTTLDVRNGHEAYLLTVIEPGTVVAAG